GPQRAEGARSDGGGRARAGWSPCPRSPSRPVAGADGSGHDVLEGGGGHRVGPRSLTGRVRAVVPAEVRPGALGGDRGAPPVVGRLGGRLGVEGGRPPVLQGGQT